MRRVEPKVYPVAETGQLILDSNTEESDYLKEYLEDVGAPDWETDAPSFGEELIEVAGRLCYRAFGTDLNANITKVREGNDKYLANILKVGHGSVLEHSSVTFIFTDVSRVFTHELVRHRLSGFSQESLRFVRLTDLGLWLPPETLKEIAKHCGQEVVDEFTEDIETIFGYLEKYQLKWAKDFKLDDGKDFGYKKKATSMMRRAAPIGLATSIMWTTNHRNLRHVLTMRSAAFAEEEIRLVFEKVGEICKSRWPNLYADFKVEGVGGYMEFVPVNNKI